MILAAMVMFLVAVDGGAQSSVALDAAGILERADALTHPEDLSGTFSMTLIPARGTSRVIRVTAYQKKQSAERENRLFLFTFPPAVEGTGLLVQSELQTDEDRMWIYLPEIGTVRRISLDRSGGGYFMGSDFTYADLITRNRDEYQVEIQQQDRIDGRDYFVVDVRGRSRALQRASGYQREEHYIRADSFLRDRIVFYDMAGELLKEMEVEDFYRADGYAYPAHVIMTNRQTGHVSEIEFDRISFSDAIPEEYFTHRYLSNR